MVVGFFGQKETPVCVGKMLGSPWHLPVLGFTTVGISPGRLLMSHPKVK